MKSPQVISKNPCGLLTFAGSKPAHFSSLKVPGTSADFNRLVRSHANLTWVDFNP